MKNKLERQIMKEFVGLSAKKYSYLKGNNNVDKKGKHTKRCAIQKNPSISNFLKLFKLFRKK